MLRRTLTAMVLAAIGLPGIIYGGVFYFVLMTIFLVGGAWEYARMYRAVHYEPHEILTVGGVLAIATARVFFVDAVMPLFVALILLAMTVSLERAVRIKMATAPVIARPPALAPIAPAPVGVGRYVNFSSRAVSNRAGSKERVQPLALSTVRKSGGSS